MHTNLSISPKLLTWLLSEALFWKNKFSIGHTDWFPMPEQSDHNPYILVWVGGAIASTGPSISKALSSRSSSEAWQCRGNAFSARVVRSKVVTLSRSTRTFASSPAQQHRRILVNQTLLTNARSFVISQTWWWSFLQTTLLRFVFVTFCFPILQFCSSLEGPYIHVWRLSLAASYHFFHELQVPSDNISTTNVAWFRISAIKPERL